MTERLKQLAAVWLGSLAFTWLFFAEYLSPLRLVHIPYDLEGYHYPLVDYAFQSLRQGRFPQWDWSTYAGMTFAGNMQVALFYPPTWLLFLANAGREHVSYQSLETFLLLHIWLASVLCFYWLRARGLGGFASVAGAQVFAFSGYLCLQLQHQGLVTAFAWFPVAAWGLDEASERRTWWPLWKLILASALCFLTGYPPMWLVFALSMTAYAAGMKQARLLLGALLALGASLVLAMIQILPAWEAARFMETIPSYGAGIRAPRFFLSYLLPNFYNFGLDVDVHTNPGMEYLYLGAPGLIGLILLIRLRSSRSSLPALLVLVANLILLTNAFGMVWGVIQHVDLLAALVRSWYFLGGLAFGATLLAAEGLDSFLQRSAPEDFWKALRSWVPLVLVAWSAWELSRWFHQGFPFGWASVWITLVTLAFFAAGLRCMRGAQGQERLVVMVTLILFAGVDYKVFGTSKRFNANTQAALSFRSDRLTGMDSEAYIKIYSQPQYRVLLDQASGPFPTDVRHWGATTPQGFDPMLTKQYKAMLGPAATWRTDRELDINPADEATLHLLGVRYFVTGDSGPYFGAVSTNPKFRLVGSAEPYFRVFEYLNAAPAYGVETGEAQLVTWNPEHRVLHVRSTGGRVYLSEQLLPGWKVTVDGATAALEPWHGALQAVQVPAGEHTVEFRYSSSGLIAGTWISLLALAGLVWMARRAQNEFPPTRKTSS